MNWKELVNKKISVIITGKDGKLESYVGIVRESGDNDFMILHTALHVTNYSIERIIFRVSLIQSVWVYKEGVNY